MARRRKKRSRRGPRQFSVINAIESYAYANLLTEGLAGNSPVGFITGGSDISVGAMTYGGSTAMTITGAEQLSLNESPVTAPVQQPTQPMAQLPDNIVGYFMLLLGL